MEQLLTDLALVKRMTARRYVRKRHALRMLVKAGVFSPEYARGERRLLQELITTWRAARSLLLERGSEYV